MADGQLFANRGQFIRDELRRRADRLTVFVTASQRKRAFWQRFGRKFKEVERAALYRRLSRSPFELH